MDQKTVVIFASSRSDGNTAKLIDTVFADKPVKIIDLKNHNITYYDYNHNNSIDDFLALIKEVLGFEKIVFATPVYWYAASAQMKTFIDRFSDLLTVEKDLGRKLRGKTAYIISTGADTKYPSCFEEMFKLTFEYLGMNYGGIHYCCFDHKSPGAAMNNQDILNAQAFGRMLV